MSAQPQSGALRDRVRRSLLAIDGIVESAGVFNEGDAFWVDGTQVAHFMDDTLVEIRLTKGEISARRATLRADTRVELRRSASDWLKLHLTSPKDADLAAELVAIAAAAHRAPAGATAKPPPIGAALERRRRFH
jgi:hypothetical protein